jgi:hypothetical protein
MQCRRSATLIHARDRATSVMMTINEARKHPEGSRLRDVYVRWLTSAAVIWDHRLVFGRASPAERYVVLGPAVADFRRGIPG